MGPAGPAGPQGPQGVPGTTGQNAFSQLGSGSLTMGSSSFNMSIPNLRTTFTVPANAIVIVTTYGGVMVSNFNANANSMIDIGLTLDGGTPFAFSRVSANNASTGLMQTDNWNITRALNLSAGQHTIDTIASWAGGNTSAVVSGDAGSQLRGATTIQIINR
jgi:hypothetical protein